MAWYTLARTSYNSCMNDITQKRLKCCLASVVTNRMFVHHGWAARKKITGNSSVYRVAILLVGQILLTLIWIIHCLANSARVVVTNQAELPKRNRHSSGYWAQKSKRN